MPCSFSSARAFSRVTTSVPAAEGCGGNGAAACWWAAVLLRGDLGVAVGEPLGLAALDAAAHRARRPGDDGRASDSSQ